MTCKKMLLACSVLAIATISQGCGKMKSGKVSEGSQEISRVEENTDSLLVEVESQSTNQQTSSSSTSSSPTSSSETSKTPRETPTSPEGTSPPPPPPPQPNIYNIVAGSEAACNAQLASSFSTCYKCSMGGGCNGANPRSWGACVQEGMPSNCPVSVNYSCKITFASGATHAVAYSSEAECRAFYQSYASSGSAGPIKWLHFNGNLLIDNERVCQISIKPNSTATSRTVTQALCKEYYLKLKENNPSWIIKSVSYDGTKFLDFARTCTLVLKSGASTAINDAYSEEDCREYKRSFVDRNPTVKLNKLVYDGKVIQTY